MSEGTDRESQVRSKSKKAWHSPQVKELGDLRTLVQSLVPGKFTPGMDGGGVGGGEEMRML